MHHINVILHFIGFASGIGFIVLLYFLHIKNKLKIMKSIIVADIFFTIILFIDTLEIYMRKNIVEHYGSLNGIGDFGYVIAGAGLCWFLTCSIYGLIGRDIMQNRKTMYLFLLSVVLLIFCILTTLNEQLTMQRKYIMYIANSYLCILFLYNSVLLLKNLSTMEESIKAIIKICLAIVFGILPMSLITNIFDFLPLFMYKIPYTPLLYFLINAVGIVAIRRYMVQKEVVEETKYSQEINDPIDVFVTLQEMYSITERENEIIKYVIVGNSNQEIGSFLYISVNTVRNHIYNIYRKMGIKNRYELINLLGQLRE